jgi:hypothetical protein
MNEGFLASQENQCIDMVHFDEDIRSLSQTLFPQLPTRPVKTRKREENSNYIMQAMMGLERLDARQCEERLIADDPLLKRARTDTRLVTQFLAKYSSFL